MKFFPTTLASLILSAGMFTAQEQVIDASKNMIDFSKFSAGDWVRGLGGGTKVTVSPLPESDGTIGCFTGGKKGKAPMIFNSSNPTGGDDDLGSPHKDFGGPGRGQGGRKGATGENAVALGNVLIISEDCNTENPDDSSEGGVFTFTFKDPKSLKSVGLLDFEEGASISATLSNGSVYDWGVIEGVGNNGFQDVKLNLQNAVELSVTCRGAISYLAFLTTKQSILPTLASEEPTPISTSTVMAVQTVEPTRDVTAVQTVEPTSDVTAVPTSNVTAVQTVKPTSNVTDVQTVMPTSNVTAGQTAEPTFLPSLQPTGVLTVSPSAKRSAAPTVVPSSLPSMTPTSGVSASPSYTICEYQNDTLVQRVKGETCADTYESDPIIVLSRTNTTVTFAVNQTWKTDGTELIDLMLTQYQSKGGEMACELELLVPSYHKVAYTAECDKNGYTEVQVMLQDREFDSNLDNAQPPEFCTFFQAGTSSCLYMVSFYCSCEELPLWQ